MMGWIISSGSMYFSDKLSVNGLRHEATVWLKPGFVGIFNFSAFSFYSSFH
jgi:hypothetical protein